MKVHFRSDTYHLVITDHAAERMKVRAVTEEDVISIIDTGTVKSKDQENKFWIYKNMKGRKDNLVCLSISIEDPFLIVITALVNWRPTS